MTPKLFELTSQRAAKYTFGNYNYRIFLGQIQAPQVYYPTLILIRSHLPGSPEKACEPAIIFPKTKLAVSSIESCQCKFDEGNIRRGLGACSSHVFIIPLANKIESY